jgi:transcriptional regulator with XRE-family HTH domain
MAPDELDRFMARLKRWAKKERGRSKEIADALGVSEQVVSNWLNRRKTPSLDHWFKLQEFARDKKIR